MPPFLEALLSPTLLWLTLCAGLIIIWLARESRWKQRFNALQQTATSDQHELEQAQQQHQALTFQRDWLTSQLDHQTTPELLIQQLAQQLPSDPLAALWTIDRSNASGVHVAVGAGHAPVLQQVAASPQLWQQLASSTRVQLEPTNPIQRGLLRWPTGQSQPRSRLLIIRCGSETPVQRLLCTTHLPVWTTDERLNLHLLGWACQHWSTASAPTPSVDQMASDEEVRMVRIMLELRTIADMEFPSPMEMLREFLRTLARATGYERVSLFLTRHDDPLHTERFCTSFPNTEAAGQEDWLQREQTLIQQHRNATDLVQLSESELVTSTESPKLGSATICALVPGADPIGYLCLTSRTMLQLQEQDQQIITWATRFLLQTLSKTVDRVVVEDQARRDALTRLANRHSFDSELHRQLKIAAATDELCSLIMLDLDHFKKINDTYGHPAGDAVLKETARRIEDVIAQTRVADRPLIARLGGEELAVLLPGVGHAGALRIGEAIRHAVRDTPVHHEGQEINFTTSIGVAVCPRNGRTANELITAADAALYAAKTAGRDRVHTAAPLEIAKPVTPVRDAR